MTASTGRAARQTSTSCGSDTSRSIPPATSTPNSAITSTGMSAPTMGPRAFVWPWSGFRESGWVYIDWVGDQPELLVDAQTGELRKVHIFVTTVGVSSMIYAEVFPDEKLPSLIAGTVHALDYYGAVPKYLVPDNLRAAVTKHTKDELILNSAYQNLEQFYEVVIIPPPARKPKGKATVEKGVQWLETHLPEDLKERVYYTIEELNRNVRRIVDNLNGRKIQGQVSPGGRHSGTMTNRRCAH